MVALPHQTARADEAPIASATVDASIARVLAAEQSARLAVAQCEQRATALVQRANERSRAIAERGAARAAFVHDWTSTTIAVRLAAIETQRQALVTMPEPNAAELQLLRGAVEQLADALAGAQGPS